MAHSPHRLTLHGRVELRSPDGTVVSFATRKALLVLAILTLGSEDGFSRADLAAMVWDESSPNAARAGLRTALVGLRSSLPGVVLAERDLVRLAPEAIELDPEENGDFMPGFDTNWAIDERLRRRARAVERLIAESRSALSDQEALEYAEKACVIDPLSTLAASTREAILRGIGRTVDAVSVGDRFRVRVLRELGTLPKPKTDGPKSAHPLISAAEWTLERDPNEACALLASTQSQWLTLSVDVSLDIYERVLAAATKAPKERKLVEAGRYSLLVLNGRLGPEIGDAVQAYRDALAENELPAASRLADALAYGYLSAGDFREALRFAREGQLTARRRKDETAIAEAEMMRSIIELHSGNSEAYHRRVAKAYGALQGVESAQLLASFQNTYAGSLVTQGKINEALPLIESCRRFVETLGSERMHVWLGYLDAILHEQVGDLRNARAILERLRDEAPAAGQSAIASVDDALLRINCELREFDQAAEALVRGAVYRRSLGTVPSVYERAARTPAVRVVRERFGSKDLAAAFRRAAAAT